VALAGDFSTVFIMIALIYKPFREWVVKKFVAPESQQNLRMDESERKQVLIENGVLALLHDSIYHECQRHIDKGYIYLDDLKNLENSYMAYSALGGNGTCEELFCRVKKLDLKRREK